MQNSHGIEARQSGRTEEFNICIVPGQYGQGSFLEAHKGGIGCIRRTHELCILPWLKRTRVAVDDNAPRVMYI